MVPNRLLKDWTDEERAKLNKAIFVAKHRLGELDFFSDENLAQLLDKHPRKDLGVNTMGTDPCRRQDWQEGEAGDLDGQALVDAVRHGRLWLNIRRVMDNHPAYESLVNRLYDELEEICETGPIFNRSANLLISSPDALVYYHVDCPLNMLWHIRGTKRVWAYPLESGIVSATTIEDVLSGVKSEEIEFRPELDRYATIVDLQPGEMITWPQHTPHRVVNTSGLNVSLSTEHMTRRALRKNNVYLANRYFRRTCPKSSERTEIDGICPTLKEAAIRVARRIPVIGPKPPEGFKYPKTFRVDPDAPYGVGAIGSPAASQKAVAVAVETPVAAEQASMPGTM